MDCVVGWQFFLTPWGLSTWLGYWLASQFPNPSWQHRVSLKHMQFTVILCHFVSILGTLLHMGGWGMLAETWSASHMTCSNMTKNTWYYWQIWCWGCWTDKFSEFWFCKPKNIFMGVAPYCVLSVNLIFGRIVKERHEKSEQPTAQLVGTSWD